MKLYKIYEGLILESITNTIDNLINGETAKNGNTFYRSARIWYENKDGSLSQRYVFIYGIGKTKAGRKLGLGSKAVIHQFPFIVNYASTNHKIQVTCF